MSVDSSKVFEVAELLLQIKTSPQGSFKLLFYLFMKLRSAERKQSTAFKMCFTYIQEGRFQKSREVEGGVFVSEKAPE